MESLHREQGDTTRPVRLDLQKSESYTGRHDHHFHVTGTSTPQRWRAGSRKRQAGSGRRERRERWVLSKTPQPSGIRTPPVEIPSTPERDPSYKWRSLRLCLQLGGFKDTRCIVVLRIFKMQYTSQPTCLK